MFDRDQFRFLLHVTIKEQLAEQKLTRAVLLDWVNLQFGTLTKHYRLCALMIKRKMVWK